MATGTNRGPSDSNEFGDRVFRLVASTALALGVGSGAWTISSTDSRYRAAEAQRDFALRDAQIGALRRELEWVKNVVDRIDRQGPAVGNARVQKELDELEHRVDVLEKGK